MEMIFLTLFFISEQTFFFCILFIREKNSKQNKNLLTI